MMPTLPQLCYYYLPPNILSLPTPKYAIISYPQICYYYLPPNMLLFLTPKYAIITYPQICYYYLPPNMLLLPPNMPLLLAPKYAIITYITALCSWKKQVCRMLCVHVMGIRPLLSAAATRQHVRNWESRKIGSSLAQSTRKTLLLFSSAPPMIL